MRLYMMEKLLFIMENTAICGIIRVVNMDSFVWGWPWNSRKIISLALDKIFENMYI